MAEINPEQIRAVIDAVKALNAIHPMIGLALGAISVIGAIITLINSIRTKKNTEANTVTVKVIDELREEITGLRSDLRGQKDETADLRDTLTFSTNKIAVELDRVKIVLVKVNNQTDQKLSMIPRVQDAVEKLAKEADETRFQVGQLDERLGRFENGLKKVVQDKETENLIFKRGKKE